MREKHVTLVFGGNPDIYRELMMAFDMSFHELGYETTVISLGKKYEDGYTPPGDINIVVDAYCRMRPNNNGYNIVFHIENNDRNDYDDWGMVLHLSPRKISEKSIYFPLGYSKAYDYQCDVSGYVEDIPISFVGRVTETRNNLLKSIKNDKYKITTVGKTWEEKRDSIIARTKINLTMKSTPTCIFESVRSNLILSKGKLLFAEEGYDGGYGYMKDYLIPFNSANFVELADKFMDDNVRNDFTSYVRNETTTKHTFTKYVKEIILA